MFEKLFYKFVTHSLNYGSHKTHQEKTGTNFSNVQRMDFNWHILPLRFLTGGPRTLMTGNTTTEYLIFHF